MKTSQRCREFLNRNNDRAHVVGENLNGGVIEQEEELLSSNSSTVVEQLIEAAGLIESGGRYIVGSKEVQTSAADSQHASFSTSTNIQAALNTCMPDAKFGLINEQYNDDHSKIISFSCQMCEHRFQYSGRQYMSRHIHACCEKYPEKANAYGLATGTCMSCLRGKPCERNSDTSAVSALTTTSSAGTTKTSLDDFSGVCIDNIAVGTSTSLLLLFSHLSCSFPPSD
jgi:hypothetical protein